LSHIWQQISAGVPGASDSKEQVSSCHSLIFFLLLRIRGFPNCFLLCNLS